MTETDTPPWTISRVCDALGHPSVAERFLGEIYRVPVTEIPVVFAKWQAIGERLLQAFEEISQAHAAELAGLPVPGDWLDASERIVAEAARIRARDAVARATQSAGE